MLENLQYVSEQSQSFFFRKSGVLRPAQEEEIAEKMHRNFHEYNWPEGWISWMDEKEIKEFHPGISCVDGGVWLPVGLTVDIPTYLLNHARLLESRGVKFITGKNYQLTNSTQKWQISFDDGRTIEADHIVFCIGSSIYNHSLWNTIKTHTIKGQLAVLESKAPLDFEHAISSLGYITSLSGNEFVVGSTYEHNYDHQNPDRNGLDYLMKRFSQVFPSLAKNSTLKTQWSGVRVSTPNRMPVLGNNDQVQNCSIFTGLASKGLLYSAYLAKLMSEFLIHGKALPEEVSIERFYKK